MIRGATVDVRVQRLPGLGPGKRGPELVLLPGWGFGAGVWGAADTAAATSADPSVPDSQPQEAGWLGALQRFGPVTLVEIDDPGAVGPDTELWSRLAALLPETAVWLGWSLGGMLAVELAVRYPGRCLALVTVASNARFVAAEGWPQAMSTATFEAFRAGFQSEPIAAWRRFLALCTHNSAAPALAASGSGGRAALHKLRTLQPRPRLSSGRLDAPLLRGLDWLASLDTRPALARLSCPVLHLLAKGDAMVPVEVAADLAQLSGSARVVVLDGGHALHVTAGAAVLEQVRALLAATGLSASARDKNLVARSFSRAAASYDTAAHLQQRVCERLLEWLPMKPGRWLDLGCGTGAALPALATRSEAPLALDLAEGMLAQAQKRHSGSLYLCGDAEQLPLADTSLDGVFSSLALQWCDRIGTACRELQRVLRPDGRALIATLGPATLTSLRQAWATLDDRVHVNDFCGRTELQAAIADAGLIAVRWEEVQEQLHYPDVLALARELRALGAHNLNSGRPRGLTGRRQLARLQMALDAYRLPAGIPAEYQVWYLELRHAGNGEDSADA